jgi:hypothetical protein
VDGGTGLSTSGLTALRQGLISTLAIVEDQLRSAGVDIPTSTVPVSSTPASPVGSFSQAVSNAEASFLRVSEVAAPTDLQVDGERTDEAKSVADLLQSLPLSSLADDGEATFREGGPRYAEFRYEKKGKQSFELF